jgi:hypothetical protein
VFRQNTKPGLLIVLAGLPVDELAVVNQTGFSEWYEQQLVTVSEELWVHNSENPRVQPGLKWGHATKVLSLFLRDLVLHTRYFPDKDADRIERWLYAPLDSIVMARLRFLGLTLQFRKLRQIDTAQKSYSVQEALRTAADSVEVPRVWFDDNWASRSSPALV